MGAHGRGGGGTFITYYSTPWATKAKLELQYAEGGRYGQGQQPASHGPYTIRGLDPTRRTASAAESAAALITCPTHKTHTACVEGVRLNMGDNMMITIMSTPASLS